MLQLFLINRILAIFLCNHGQSFIYTLSVSIMTNINKLLPHDPKARKLYTKVCLEYSALIVNFTKCPARVNLWNTSHTEATLLAEK